MTPDVSPHPAVSPAVPWADSLPSRPLLAPGVRLVRRDRDHLQVGLEPGRRVVVADTAEVRECVAALREGRRPDLRPPAALACCRALLEAGLVVDGDALLAALPADPDRRRAVAALFAESGGAAPRLLRQRSTTWVSVDAPSPWRGELARLLELAGLATSPSRARSPRPPAAEVLMTIGEPGREQVDRWHRTGRPHLLVAAIGDRVRIGPFVAPGRTACLRCVDAHARDRDAAHALVLEQYAAAAESAVPAPADPALVAVGLGWAARDLLTWVDGGRPATWSATVEATSQLELTPRRWLRHPRCGCSWAEDLVAG